MGEERKLKIRQPTKGTKYGDVFGSLATWALGQRALHDLVIHPLLALTNYSDWVVKLHDYHGSVASAPADGGLVGVTGSQRDVEAIFSAIGVTDEDVHQYHTDGLLCYGTVHYNPLMTCPACRGLGYHRDPNTSRRRSRDVLCIKCKGTGTVQRPMR